jgi:TolA-binding protein
MVLKRSYQAVALILISGLFVMCASSNPQLTSSNDDQMMASDTSRTGEGDDVLELLGIPSGEVQSPDMAAVMAEKDEMEKKVRSLEAELADKDSEIIGLKRDVEQKDAKLNELENVLTEIETSTPATQPVSDYVAAYEMALSQYRNRSYQAAIQAFENLLQLDNSNSYSDNAQYWIGECYYGMGNYQRALLEFEKVFGFVDSNKEDASQLKIALCYEKLNQNDSARDALQRLMVKYPDSEYLDFAQQVLARL